MASKLINFVALSTLAVLAVSFGPSSTNALASGHAHLNRHVDHVPIGKRKRGNAKRCKVRSTASSLVLSTSSVITSSVHTSAKPVPTTKAEVVATTQAPPKPSTQAPAPVTTSTPVKAPSPPPGNGKFGQKGSKIVLAWPNGNDPSLKNFKTDHVVGLYTWGPDKPSQSDALGFEFMSMLWGDDQSKIDHFHSQMQNTKPGTIVLGFNEPNEVGQSNMDPFTAAAVWKAHIEQYCRAGHPCGTPAMSSRPNGNQWMKDFMKSCDGCTFTYQLLHWYDIGAAKLQDYLTQYHNEIGLPIIVSEFADQNFNGGPQATMDEIFQFYSQAGKWLEETDWIVGYAPFGVMHDLQGVNTHDSLMTSSGGPTDLGFMIINNAY